MKKALLIIACLHALAVNAQSWKKVRMTIDTFKFNGESVIIERIAETELNKFLTKGGYDYQAAMAISKLQEQLNSMKSYVKDHREINFSDVAKPFLEELQRRRTEFDPTNYENEYNFYLRYKYPNKVVYNQSAKQEYRKTMNALEPIALTLYKNVKDASNFNVVLMSALPEYQLVLVDTVTQKDQVVYTYKNADGEAMAFRYSIQAVGGNRDLKIESRSMVTRQSVSGQFLSILKVYNKLFSLTVSPEEAQAHREYGGIFVYDGEMYNYMFASIGKGYWEIVLFKRN